ncbi:peroxiredoxin-like family protein [Kistimonas scapharcae]|uniref:Peroxiredoxin-like family protein n=2 Tax=Kistimonas scapharcae TaxID=1036133 RepID=A0ABP8V5T3_9GAMM
MGVYKLAAAAPFPNITLPTLESTSHTLGQPQEGFEWCMVVIYRGKHCPLCTRYLNQLETLKQRLHNLKVDLVAASADSREQLSEHMQQLSISFPVTYGLTVEHMHQLGLYISSPRSPQETDHPFSEPGLFVINEHGVVQVIDISNSPSFRPELETVIAGAYSGLLEHRFWST